MPVHTGTEDQSGGRRRRNRLGKMVFDEISFVDRGMNPHAEVVFWKREGKQRRDGEDETPAERRRRMRRERRLGPRAAADTASRPGFLPTGRQFLQQRMGKQDEPRRTVNGESLPRQAFAFVPDPESPSTWKLPLFETARDVANNRPSIQRTAAAATALTGAGFRGQRVQIPNADRARVKARILRAWLKARRDADQDVTRDDAPAILKGADMGIAKVLTVTVATQESGGRSPHTHTIEFPDGAIGPGTWETSEDQDHTHRVEITGTIEPGDTRTLNTEAAEPDPPEGIEQHVHSLTINVPDEEDEAAEEEEVSQRDKYQIALDGMRNLLGREPSEEMRKQLFDEVRAKASREDAFNVIASRIEDLSKSVFDILFLPDDDDGQDPSAMLTETFRQFVDSTTDELPEIMAGRIIKQFAKSDGAPPDPEDFQEELLDFINESQTELVGEEQEEEGMDLSKLTPEDRAVVEKALEAAGLVEQLNKSLEDAKSKIEELEKQIADGAASNDDKDDVTKGLPPAAAEFVKSLQSKNETLEKQVNEMANFSKKAALKETVISKVDSLAMGPDDVVEALWNVTDDATREAILKLLEAANEAVKKSATLGGQLGSDAVTGATNAEAKFSALAEEIMKRDPKITAVEARARAITENPEVYDEYLAEQGQRH